MKQGFSGLAVVSDPPVRFLWLATLALTLSLFYWLLWLRGSVFDPSGLTIFWRLVVFQDYWAALLMVPVILLAVLPLVQRVALEVSRWIGRHPGCVALVTVLLLGLGAKIAYHAHPLSMDEYSPWLQSYVFAAGHVTGLIPPQLVDWVVPAGFQGYFINVSHETGRIASAYWPGFALLLAPFSALGVPWLLNPLLGGAVVMAIYSLAMRLSASREVAGLAVLLTLACQAFTINAMSFYSMNAHLLANLLFVLLLIDVTPGRAFVAGIVGSLALVLHNPVPHLLFAAPWILWIVLVLRDRRTSLAIFSGYLPLCLVLGLGWSVLNAHWFGSEILGAENDDFVAHWIAKFHEVFRLPNAGVLYARLAGLAKLWLWAVPGLVLLAAAGWWRCRRDRSVMLLGLSAVTTLVGFLFVPFDQGHGWGFRYFHSAWGVLPILAGLAVPGEREEGGARAVRGMAAALPLVASSALLWFLVGTSLRVAQVEAFMAEHLAQLPAPEYGPAPVRIVNPVNGYYAFDLIQNDPFLRGPLILVTHGRPRDAEMMHEQFPALVLRRSAYRGQVWDAPPQKERAPR